jgi:N-acetylglucosaminyldiphosphoundecaprenol N-acetyl-beta-D-mannosaminyltransferase
MAIGPQPLVVAAAGAEPLENVAQTTIWGLPLARVTSSETVDLVEKLIERRRPSFFITANLHYALLTDRDPRLAELNRRAAFLVADGMPMVWYSRLVKRPLPQRVAGADLVYQLCQRAALRGHRVFLLGGQPGVAEAAAANLCGRYPGLQIVGVEAPPFRTLSDMEHRDLLSRIRRARPDLLLVAFGQPKGELWLGQHYEALGVPVCVQMGATLDFVAGRVRRAPRGLQRVGLEWLYRALQEPRRLGPRYLADAVFLGRAILRDMWRR